MGYEYEVAAVRRRTMKTWIRPAARVAFAAGCALVALQATSAPAAAMTEEACQQLSAEQLLVAVDQGVCTLDVLPSAGPAPQIADSGTTGEHDGGDPRSGGDSGDSGGDPRGGGGDSGGGGSGGGAGDGDGGADDGGGDSGGDSGGSGSGGDDGGSGGDDGHDHDHNHGHGHSHGHGGHGHGGGCGE